MRERLFQKNLVEHRNETSDNRTGVLAKSAAGSAGISGTAYTSDGVTPYPGHFRVTVLDTFGFELISKNINSDDNGVFLFTGLPSGSYTLAFDITDYGPWYSGNTDDPFSARFIRLSEGQTSSGNDVVFPPAAVPVHEKMITLSGRLTSDSPVPPNTRITVTGVGLDGQSDARFYGSTNADNTFSLSGVVRPGEYYLTVSVGGYEPQWWGGGGVFTAVPTPVLLDSDISAEEELQLERGATVSGKITRNNESFFYSFISLMLISEDGYRIAGVNVSASDSVFSFSGVPAGKYYLKYHVDYYLDSYRYYPSAKSISDAKLFDIEKEQVIDSLDVVLPSRPPQTQYQTGNIRASITYDTDERIDGKAIFVYENPSVDIDNHEWFDDGILDGTVAASEPFKINLRSYIPYYAASTWYPNRFGNQPEDYVTVEQDGSIELTIPLTVGGSAGGFIQDSDGKAVNFEKLREMEWEYLFITKDPSGEVGLARHSVTGGFRFVGMQPGTYTAWACLIGDGRFPEVNSLAGTQGYAPGSHIGPFSVTSGTTTDINGTAVMESGAIKISSIPNGSVALCYDSDDRLIAMLFFDSNKENNYCGMLLRDTDFPAKIVHSPITIPFLRAGDYRVAVLTSSDYDVEYYWYGSKQKILVENVSNEEDLLLKTVIPDDAQAITVKDDQITDISYGTSSTLYESRVKQEQFSLKAYPKSNSSCLISYDMGGATVGKCALAVYSLNGRCIKRWSIASEGGSVVWSIGRGVSSGTYFIVLKDDNRQKVLKLPLAR